MRMRINFIIPSTVLGGGLRVAFTYANYLVDQGHDVISYLPGIYRWKDVPKINIKTSISNSILRRNKMSWFDVKFPIHVVPNITNTFIRDADVSIATAWFTARNVYDLSESKGKKVYFIQDYEIWNQNKDIVDSTYRLDMKRITITNTLKQTIQRECGVDSTVVYNGHSSKEYLHSEKKINHPRTIIMLGNFASYKGGDVGLRILEIMHEKYKIRAVIFGAQPKKNLPSFVEYYHQPQRNVLISLYKKADIYLFPSKQEAWGLSAIEAMANKVAVVGYRTGCLAEIGKNKENALIVDVGNEKALELAVESLMFDDELLATLQNNGYNTVTGLTWEAAGERFEKELFS